MRTRRRILLTLLVLALAVPLTATAGAKGGKPLSPTHYVQMGLVEIPADGYFDGLATTCEDPILMVQGPGGRLGAGGNVGGDADPNLWIEGLAGLGVPSGCHGDAIWWNKQAEYVPYPGQLMITRDVNDDPTEIKFWFDAVAEKVEIRRGQKVTEETVLQSRYTLVSTALTPGEASGTFEGTFELSFWTRTPAPGEDNNTYLGSADLKFTFEVDPDWPA